MKRLLIVILLCSVPAAAQQPAKQHSKLWRYSTAVPRAYGRTVQNMFTFKRPWIAVQEWLVVGAGFADGASTHRVLVGCAGCRELNPLLGRRPGNRALWTQLGPLVIGEAAMVQYTGEIQDDWWYMSTIVTASHVGLHTWAAVHNYNLAARDEARKRLGPQ
jgi:hypothetical protein